MVGWGASSSIQNVNIHNTRLLGFKRVLKPQEPNNLMEAHTSVPKYVIGFAWFQNQPKPNNLILGASITYIWVMGLLKF